MLCRKNAVFTAALSLMLTTSLSLLHAAQSYEVTIERAVTAPSLKTIAAAAEALDVSLLDLFAGYDKQPAKTSRRGSAVALIN